VKLQATGTEEATEIENDSKVKERINKIPSVGGLPKNTQLLQTIIAYDVQR
jgi:hypothetical protein